MNNFRNTGKSPYYQPPMKKRGVSTLDDIEESRFAPESTQTSPPQNAQPNCPPPEPPQQSPCPPPHRPPQPNRPNQPNNRPPQPPQGRPPYRPNQRPSNRPTPPRNSSSPNSEQLDRLVDTASKHLNTSPEELKNAAQNGNMQKLFSQMTPAQAQQLQKILSDENAAKKLLSTPQAQALLRGLSKNE